MQQDDSKPTQEIPDSVEEIQDSTEATIENPVAAELDPWEQLEAEAPPANVKMPFDMPTNDYSKTFFL
jgi:hypothetical protein